MPNPALNEETFGRFQDLAEGERMTLGGTINKITLLCVLTFATALVSVFLTLTQPGLAFALIWGGLICGLGLAIATIVKPQWAPATAPAYAFAEGLLLGALSLLFEAKYQGIAIQAIMITFGAFGAMLLAYRSGVIRATPTFVRVVVTATGAIMVVYLVSLGMRVFGAKMPFLHDATPLGIAISLGICVIAALNFILDFKLIEDGVESGAPKYMEWYAGFSLLVTLIWLYIEVLRLLSKLRR